MHKHPIVPGKLRRIPRQFSWVDQRWVRERYIAQLSSQACALSLFLVTAADAQGLSSYADRSLCQRLSLHPAELQQARQALLQRGLLASRRPLSQVLALETEPLQDLSLEHAGDDSVDITAVFARIWEVLA